MELSMRHGSVPKTLNPLLAIPQYPSSFFRPSFPSPLLRKVSILKKPHCPKAFSVVLSLPQNPSQSPTLICSDENPTLFPCLISNSRRTVRCLAGRSKNKADSPFRLEGSAERLRQFKRNARRKGKKLADSFFYRLKNPHKNYPDNFTEDELQAIGLGYDRMVRFMEKDDPNLKHPYDWYKYGEFGPFSWRGVVLGDPIRGKFTDERVSIIGEVKDHEEWEKIEQFDMVSEFGKRVNQMDKSKGIRYYWIFVRHPKWRLSDLPWQQWTLVAEVAVEAGKQRLDKWSLMGRLGNTARRLVTQCAAWMRPDIIYVKRPVYQCRFEPQEDFLNALIPFLDPNTEKDFVFELENDDGRVELSTYFGALCKIVRVNPKAFVDDVVNAYEKLSDEKKSKCLEFLLTNHPVQLLHPYTKEWKAKLEEMELGCDAPDDDDDVRLRDPDDNEVLDWIEDDGDNLEGCDSDDDDGYDDMREDEDEDEDENEEGEDEDDLTNFDVMEDDMDTGENISNWRDDIERAKSSGEAIENLAKRSIEMTSKLYEKHLRDMEAQSKKENSEDGESQSKRGNSEDGDEAVLRNTVNLYEKHLRNMEAQSKTENSDGETQSRRGSYEDGDETLLRGKRAKVSPEEWKYAGIGPWRKRVVKSRLPPDVFLRAAVRPFTYRNLVKEIVLTRHAILDGDIGRKA